LTIAHATVRRGHGGGWEISEEFKRELQETYNNERDSGNVDTGTERALRRVLPASMQAPDASSASVRQNRAFSRYLNRGIVSRDMSEGTAGAGGYLVPPGGFLASVLFGLAYTSGILARIRTWNSPTGNPATIPTILDTTTNALQVNEGTLINEADSTVGRVVFGNTPPIITGLVRAGRAFVQDAQGVSIDLDQMLADQWGFRLARYLDALAVTQLSAGLTNTYTTAVSATCTYVDLMELIFSTNLAARGSQSSALVVSPSMAKHIMELADTQGRPLVLNQNYVISVDSNTAQGGSIERNVSVPTLAGFPLVESPALATFAAGNVVGIFADFAQAAILRLPVRAMSVQKLVERYADYGEFGWLGYARADIQVADPLAGAILKIHA